MEDLQVDGADHQGDEDGLGDAAVREALAGVGEVDAVALRAPVESLVVGPDRLVDVLPRPAEVAELLPELIALAKVAWVV
ncbi:hypothetical protein [Streptomyces orinoci]|uniref:Uncharacterized protein n=1 Tax=Streptomyces orinoci TaxID=67339 RepID=A0ABV3K2S3_STRON|nr:hypothetical protein [Streptomyces orinoci]